MNHLSDRINSLSESQTIAMAKKARELAAQGYKVINLSFGEPDFQTPDHIKAAAKRALDEGYTFYTPVAGYPELKKAICNKLQRDNGLTYAPENIVVSTGAKQSIINVILCLVNPGEEVLIVGPYWVSYLEMVKLAEGIPVVVSGTVEQGFKPSLEQIEKAISPKTKAILYSSPSNPTGAMFSVDELAGLSAILKRHPNVYAIADEIYEFITFNGKPVSLASFAETKGQVITVNGFSKGFAMTGWRVGYIAAEKWIADACDKLQGQFTSGTCSIAQRAAIAALEEDLAPTHAMRDAFLRRRDLVHGLLQEIKGLKTPLPDGAFYFFPDVSAYFGKRSKDGFEVNNCSDFSMYILQKAHVSIVPGDAFGDDNCIRISFAASDEQLIDAVNRIKLALAELA